MTFHLFEAGSSPGCSNFALKHTTKDGEEECRVRAAETLKKNFYVDDALKSVPTQDEAIINSVIQDCKKMCARGGFNLSSSYDVSTT